ncbi:MAG: hypothetical protein R6V45_11890 [Oceanipulchritudo sp.]
MKPLLPIALLTVVLGLVAHVGVFFFFRIERPSVPESAAEPTVMEFVGDLDRGRDPVLREQALLRDSAPVFMPTRWNLASEMAGVASLRESTEVFASFPAHIRLPDEVPESLDPDPEPFLFSQLLPEDPQFYLSLLGRNEAISGGGSPSRPSWKAERIGRDAVVVKEDNPLPAVLEAVRPEALWNPAQFFLQIHEGKAVGVPLIARSTGFTEWDQALQDYAGSLEFYARLEDGYYRITIYP